MRTSKREVGVLATEIGESAALAIEQSTFDLVDEDTAAPAMLEGLPRVPFALRWGFYEVNQVRVMAPRQLCNKLLHN
jgi:hypothetical protein